VIVREVEMRRHEVQNVLSSKDLSEMLQKQEDCLEGPAGYGLQAIAQFFIE